MDEGADTGDIISQEILSIYPLIMLLHYMNEFLILRWHRSVIFCRNLSNGNVTYTPQSHTHANTWRKRGALDGCIDWRMAACSIHNLVRGLTKPYVGAHFEYNDSSVKVWETEIVSGIPINIEPGKVIEVSDSSILVKAGVDAIRLLDYYPIITVCSGSYL